MKHIFLISLLALSTAASAKADLLCSDTNEGWNALISASERTLSLVDEAGDTVSLNVRSFNVMRAGPHAYSIAGSLESGEAVNVNTTSKLRFNEQERKAAALLESVTGVEIVAVASIEVNGRAVEQYCSEFER